MQTVLTNYIVRYIVLCIGFITAHYLSAHLYVWWCVPYGVKGYVMSPFLTLSPHCQFLRWVTYNGGVCINACWVLFGSWLISKCQCLVTNIVGLNDKEECDKKCVQDSEPETDESEKEESDHEEQEEEEKEKEKEKENVEDKNARTKLRTLRNRLRYKKNT